MREDCTLNAEAKKIALRMIPYGLYVLTSSGKNGAVAAAAISWVTQTSFKPPRIAMGVKTDSGAHALIKESGTFALNMLEKGQQEIATAFFRHVEREGNSVGGQPFEEGKNGSPLLLNAPAWVECTLVGTVEGADHSVFVGEVTEAGTRKEIEGRPDDLLLLCKDLGENVFYSG